MHQGAPLTCSRASRCLAVTFSLHSAAATQLKPVDSFTLTSALDLMSSSTVAGEEMKHETKMAGHFSVSLT